MLGSSCHSCKSAACDTALTAEQDYGQGPCVLQLSGCTACHHIHSWMDHSKPLRPAPFTPQPPRRLLVRPRSEPPTPCTQLAGVAAVHRHPAALPLPAPSAARSPPGQPSLPASSAAARNRPLGPPCHPRRRSSQALLPRGDLWGCPSASFPRRAVPWAWESGQVRLGGSASVLNGACSGA